MDKKAWVVANTKWLERKAQEEGVMPLAGGTCYRVITSGDDGGEHPTASSVISAHYTGRLIDGRQFDTSLGGAPLAIRPRDLIKGWQVALGAMRVGDKWEVYIPASMGYGKFAQPGIPGGSTLVFEIELLRID